MQFFLKLLIFASDVRKTQLFEVSVELVRQKLFYCSDIPPDVDSITVGIHNAAKRTKHAHIGEAVIHFRKLSQGKTTDEW